MQPDFYNRFYEATSKSSIHSQFCKFAYGIDLCQHGFADKYQLDLIFQTTRIDFNTKILDLGCGNGSITEYLCSQKFAFYTGLDNNEVAIKQAQARTQNNNKHLTFIVGDINNLQLPDNLYDNVLSIDTIYFSTNYDATLSRIYSSLKSHGNLLIFYSIGPALLQTKEFPHYLLEPETTPLAESFKRMAFHSSIKT
jgi:ubiquinone/menaquinone biosynthesis C-methylase UbiE